MRFSGTISVFCYVWLQISAFCIPANAGCSTKCLETEQSLDATNCIKKYHRGKVGVNAGARTAPNVAILSIFAIAQPAGHAIRRE